MNSNWNEYKRKQCNINKSIQNDQVSKLMIANYSLLYKDLVKEDTDIDIFNDVYLKLTYNYNPNKDYVVQFVYYFNMLKGAYYRDNKVTLYAEQPLINDYQDSTVKQKIVTNKDLINELYANFKKVK